MLYDAHCHLQDPRLKPYRAEIIAALREIGVSRIVVNGTAESDWAEVLGLASTCDLVMPSLGLHPWFVRERVEGWHSRLERLTPRAIGEIGLDRWIHGFNEAEQEQVFIQQLRTAAKRDLPLSIHCLKAWGRLLEILSSEPLPDRGFLLHSYGGPAEMVEPFQDLGAYFSISGYFAHPRKDKQRSAFRRVPIDRLLVETDAPDMLLPEELVEFRLADPELNHPANLRAIYRFAAELRDLPLETFTETIEQNFQRLFHATPAN